MKKIYLLLFTLVVSFAFAPISENKKNEEISNEILTSEAFSDPCYEAYQYDLDQADMFLAFAIYASSFEAYIVYEEMQHDAYMAYLACSGVQASGNSQLVDLLTVRP